MYIHVRPYIIGVLLTFSTLRVHAFSMCTQASQGSYAVDTDSPLFRARLKFQDACSVKSSDAIACFHFGRLNLLLGEKEEALKYLKNALAQKPNHSAIRFCLGLALSSGEAKHAKPLLWHGLNQYLLQVGFKHNNWRSMSLCILTCSD